jgi:GNAT superfamily N-acetyltransferase
MTSTRFDVCIRGALPEAAEALTALILRAKGYWGYDQSFLEACRSTLSLKAESIEHDLVYGAEVGSMVVGVSHLKRVAELTVCLDDLFVEPAFIGQGGGGLLWRHAVKQAQTMGATSLVLEADPHAQPCYEYMGAVVEGYNLAPIVPGRQLPRMRYAW